MISFSLPPYPPYPTSDSETAADDGEASSDGETPADAEAPPDSPEPAAGAEPADSGAELLAERTAALVALAGRGLSALRLLGLWAAAAVAVLGWAAVGLAIQSFESGGAGLLTGLVALFLAGIFLVPAAVALGLWLHRGEDVRDRLDAWADLGPAPVTDERVRAHARCVAWLLPSVAMFLVGTGVGVRAVSRAETVALSETSYALGLGTTLLVTGLLGVVQSVGHQRWAGRLLDPVPVRERGGAHR